MCNAILLVMFVRREEVGYATDTDTCDHTPTCVHIRSRSLTILISRLAEARYFVGPDPLNLILPLRPNLNCNVFLPRLF